MAIQRPDSNRTSRASSNVARSRSASRSQSGSSMHGTEVNENLEKRMSISGEYGTMNKCRFLLLYYTVNKLS